jgi:DNA-binding NarL/FixJ family response regulator
VAATAHYFVVWCSESSCTKNVHSGSCAPHASYCIRLAHLISVSLVDRMRYQSFDNCTTKPVSLVHRILICEDNAALAADFASLIKADDRFELVAAAASGEEAIEVLSKQPIDVLLLDLGLPGVHGLEVLAAMRRLQPNCEALVVTVFGDEQTVLKAVEAGASGYVLKREVSLSLIRRIEELLAGGSPITPSIARLLLTRVQTASSKEDAALKPATNTNTPPIDDSDESATLSEREIDVLTLISKGMSVQEVGELLAISGNTVKTYIRRIYKKLEVRSRIEAIYEARAMGLLDNPSAATRRVPPAR